VRWIAGKTTQPVDQIKPASYSITEVAQMPVFMIFCDFKDPIVAAKSDKLMKTMDEIGRIFEPHFKIFWTDDPIHVNSRRALGVTWDELPAMAFNTLDSSIIPFPRNHDTDLESLKKWFANVSSKGVEYEKKTGNF
jgi:hypothetical protein